MKYSSPWDDGVLPVVARNQYEAIGKAMTIYGMDTTAVDPASIKVEKLKLLHPDDQKYSVKVEELSDVVENAFTG